MQTGGNCCTLVSYTSAEGVYWIEFNWQPASDKFWARKRALEMLELDLSRDIKLLLCHVPCLLSPYHQRTTLITTPNHAKQSNFTQHTCASTKLTLIYLNWLSSTPKSLPSTLHHLGEAPRV